MSVLYLKLILKGGLLVFLVARRLAASVVRTSEIRHAILEAFEHADHPECVVPKPVLHLTSARRGWREIVECHKRGWLNWDMMIRITPYGRERLARYRGEPHARLPHARALQPRSHP